jgi:hypothetical protein
VPKLLTGLSNGEINVLYSPLTSLNGAKLLLSKGPPRKRTFEDISDAQAAPNIITPHALPMFRDGDGIRPGNKRKWEKERMDPRKSRRPELPVTGPGRGGRVGASATQHVVQNLVRDTTRDEDVGVNFFPYYTVAVVSAVFWLVHNRGWVSMSAGGMFTDRRKFPASRWLPALIPFQSCSWH